MKFYKKTWNKNPITSFFCFMRDLIIFLIPVKRLPDYFIKILFGFVPKFVFYVHPRRAEDTYVAYPFFGLIRRIFGKNIFLKLLEFFPPLVLGTCTAPSGVNGLIVTGSLLPDILMKNKKKAISHCVRGLYFSAKISKKGSIFGLGALWPMVTRRGIALKPYCKTRDMIVTNGHCGTLIGIYFSIIKLSELASIPLEDFRVAILGVGRMGANLAHVLYGQIRELFLIDINEARLNKTIESLTEKPATTSIKKHLNNTGSLEFKNILRDSHVAVCCTSNITRILKPEHIPENCIIIDDSRPEGIPRDIKDDSRIVTEGGIMKIKGIKQDYDFGFGIDENVFGCFAESYLLASDIEKILQPTLGGVDFDNFKKMTSACKKFGVELGDFKCRDEIIDNKTLCSILKRK